jgi:multiple antibiotic resistance protein
MIEFLPVFIVFFSVIDPIGTVPVFIAVTAGKERAEKMKTALQSVLTATAVLIFFVIAGEPILSSMDIPLPAFEIAGGIVLFLFALTMIFGESKSEEELKMVASTQNQAVFPLAVPSIASPGAMLAAVMQTQNALYDIAEQVQVTAMMLAVLGVTLVLMLGSSFVYRLIGDSGASIISRVMGLILASVAVASVLNGIKDYFSL